MPYAIITGVAGQDGSYLSELLLEKGYHVFGMIRRNSSIILDRLQCARQHPNFHLIYGDLTDIASLFQLFNMVLEHERIHDPIHSTPIEVYNLAAQSHVKVSFETPMYTTQSDAVGVLNILEVIVRLKLTDPSRLRFYQASTSELYGNSPAPQSENTAFHPRSPYAIAKLYGYWTVRNYREAHNMFAVNGILFNHESERRGETFVSRKITRAVANLVNGNKNNNTTDVLTLGNLYAKRDWGHAQDYVRAMWLMLQHPTPHDFVIATGTSHTVKDFVDHAFMCVGIQLTWKGTGDDEKAYDSDTGKLIVQVDQKYHRPTEVNELCGDVSKAKRELNWSAQIGFKELVHRMVIHDIHMLQIK